LKGGRGDYFLKSHNSFASCQPLRALQEEEKKKKIIGAQRRQGAKSPPRWAFTRRNHLRIIGFNF
jgi:hypothetical protein